MAAGAALLGLAGAAAAARAPRQPDPAAARRPVQASVARVAPSAAGAPLDAGMGEGPAGRTPLTRWTFRLDAADRGLARGWQRGGFGGSSVSVPHVIEAGHFKGPGGWRNYEGSIAWYRTTFATPQEGRYALQFASANFRARVWIDGHAAGSHVGSYLPFEAQAQLDAGTHTAVVRIDWRDPAAQSHAGFHRTWFNWGGLNGRVSGRPLGDSDLSEPAVQTTLSPLSPAPRTAALRVSVQVHNYGLTRTLQPEGTLSRDGQSIPIAFPPQLLQHGETSPATTTVTVPRPALWSPSSLALYELTLRVGAESSFSTRVGLRQLSWQPGRVYLNGRRVRLHGASLQEDALGHGDALTAADQDELVHELRAIHANAVRSQHPLDAGLLERLDAAGIMVWQGIGPVEGAGNWYSSTPSLLRSSERQAQAAALDAAAHPAIVAWNLVDEVAGNGRNGWEVRYVQSLTRWLHTHDRTRMVAVDVWGSHPPSRAGVLYRGVDAVAETDYTGWYDSPRVSAGQQVAMMRARLSAMHRTFAGKVLLISEFGAESNALNPPGAPGSYSFQAALLARHIAVYAADRGLSGMFIWDLRDYPLIPGFQGGSIHDRLPRVRIIEGLIQKGLFTYAGTPKPAVRTVARVFRSLPAG